MARTIATIRDEIIAQKEATAALSELDSTSAVAVWRLWVYVVAVAIHVHETLFDAHKKEVQALLDLQRPHTVRWYVTKAKLFQYGSALLPDSDVYDPIVEADQIVKLAAAVEVPSVSTTVLRLKVAKLVGGSPAALSAPEMTAFNAYMQIVKDAGVNLQCTTGDPDDVRLTYEIYYDPLVLDAAGARLDGTLATPVKDAVNNYLGSLIFNGLFIVNKCTEAIMAVDGVVIARCALAQARYGALAYTPFLVEYRADAGYLVLDEADFDDNVTYIPHDPII
jgi:hypothetical protein